LNSYKKPEHLKKRDEKMSLYDMEKPSIRKGVAGWKLTRRPIPKIAALDFKVTNSINVSQSEIPPQRQGRGQGYSSNHRVSSG
jgi:hypothetical protein